MDYDKYFRRQELKFIIKILLLCLLIFAVGAFVAYSNTRYNGFGDTKPFSFYIAELEKYLKKIASVLSNFSGRFFH